MRVCDDLQLWEDVYRTHGAEEEYAASHVCAVLG